MDLTTVNEVRSSALSLQEHLEAMIDMLAGQIRDQAYPDGDMAWLQNCAKEIELLKADLRALEAIRDHAVAVLTDSLSFDGDQVDVSSSGLRNITVEISQGMLNQHLLTLTDAKQQGLVRDGEKFAIQLPDGAKFETELCDPGNKLRERGLIRKFYEDSKINAGDKVIMSEVSRGSWILRPATAADRLAGMQRYLDMVEKDKPAQAPQSEPGNPSQLP